MLAAGIKSPILLEELESHLREEIDRQIRLGLSGQKAFDFAVSQIGGAKPIKLEFMKLENWNRPLAWSAWILYVTSFFLPAYGSGGGWQCAWLSADYLVSRDFWHGSFGSGDYHLALLTLANVFMIVSPFLLVGFRQKVTFRKWFGVSALLALALVWSFILRLLMDPARSGVRFGCFVWGFSFLPLCLSIFPVWHRKIASLKYV